MDNMISKYPTLKVFRNGKVQRYEYRGQRSVDAFTNFVRQQMKSSLNEYTNKDEFKPDVSEHNNDNVIQCYIVDCYSLLIRTLFKNNQIQLISDFAIVVFLVVLVFTHCESNVEYFEKRYLIGYIVSTPWLQGGL